MNILPAPSVRSSLLTSAWVALVCACGPAAVAPLGPGPAPPSDPAAVGGAAQGAWPAAWCALPAVAEPEWYHLAVGYEVFVRSWRDASGDGVGDLDGLRAGLSALSAGAGAGAGDGAALGVDLLWLMPILESPSYHGYDVKDYYQVEPDYGDEASLRRLLDDAHARGVRVVMDLVLNHASNRHPWFLASAQHPDGEHAQHFVWREEEGAQWGRPWDAAAHTWHQKRRGWYYGLFTREMPDWNWSHKPVVQALTDVARHWLRFGLDGFRLDAVRYLIEDGPGPGQSDTASTHARWAELREALDAARADALLVGEAWAEPEVAAAYLGEPDRPAMHMVFDFGSAAGSVKALRQGVAAPLRRGWCARWAATPAHGAMGTFLGNHDLQRVATTLADRSPRALRVGAALLLTGPGTPWIYYGEELGLESGTPPGDLGYRLPLPWDDGPHGGFSTAEPWITPGPRPADGPLAQQRRDPSSLWSLYRDLIALRRAHPALSVGAAALADTAPAHASAFTLLRQLGTEHYAVVFNLGDEPLRVRPALREGGRLEALELLFADGATLDGGQLALEPLSFAVLHERHRR